ncbi:MAG: electron transport complex subunit RsxA [Candidatus Latescibacteria bacterium]|nr:electron transport complex subunit RsxA [Candidatus Latescibacterota bacterium]
MDLGNLFVIVIASIFVNNFVLARFLGICPYIGVSRRLDSALSMGIAVTFVMTLASAATWLIYMVLLAPETNVWGVDLIFLKTIAFILVIAVLVQLIEMIIQKTSAGLYKALGIYLPLITTNCAILGVTVLNIEEGYSFIESLIHSFSAGVGFTMALVLMSGLREKYELAELPESMKGAPIAFITAGLMAIAFLGFSGLSLK